MSYMLTHIRIHGVMLTYEEARAVLEIAGNIGFVAEYENDFQSVAEDFGKLDRFDMQMLYDDLQSGLSPSYPYHTFESLGDFFDYFSLPTYQVASCDRDTIPTVYDEKRGIQFHRRRYYADLFCEDADSRGDSLRLMPNRTSAYGIYIASDGYAYRDDIKTFDSDPRIETNFTQYCQPVLERLNIAKTPARLDIWQTW